MVDTALTFDDLVPESDNSSAALTFDDLIPRSVSTSLKDRRAYTPMAIPATSRDANDLRPSSTDVSKNWAPTGVVDEATQRFKQFSKGAANATALAPEGLAAIAASGNRGRKLETLASINDRKQIIADLQTRLKNPSISADEREFRLQQIADLTQGNEKLIAEAMQPTTPAKDTDLYKSGKSVRQFVAKTVGEPNYQDKSWAGNAFQNAGSIIPTIAITAAGTIAGAPEIGLVGAAGQGITSGAGSFYNDAISGGATEIEAEKAAKWGALSGVTEVLPVGRILNVIPSPLKGKIANAFVQRILKIGENAGEEGLQEWTQQVTENLDAAGILPGSSGYDPKRKWDEGALESAIMGAVVGGGTGAIFGGSHKDTAPTVAIGEVDPATGLALSGAPAPNATAPNATAPNAPAPNAPTTPKLTEEESSSYSEVTDEQKAAISGVPINEPGANPPPTGPSAPIEKAPDTRTIGDIVREKATAAAAAKAAAKAAAEKAGANPPPTEPSAPPETETPEAKTPETEGDTLPTVPESADTIAAQNKALLDLKNPRKAVFIPYGNDHGEAPVGATVVMVPTKEGILYLNTKKGLGIKAAQTLLANGQLGQVLGLGSFTKADVAKSAAKGNAERVVTERTAQGVEVKSAAGTTETAPTQLKELEANKGEGNTVQIEDPAKVLAERLAANQISNSTEQVQKPTEQVASETNPAAATLAERLAENQTTPANGSRPDLIAEYNAKYATSEKVPEPISVPEKIKAVSKERSAPKAVTPKGKKTEVVTDPVTGKQSFRIIPSAEEQRAINEGNDKFNAARSASAGAELDTTEIEAQREKADRGELGANELDSRRTGQGKDAAREAKAVEAAQKAQELLDATPYNGVEEIRSLQDASKVYDRLMGILRQAKESGVTIPGRITPSHTNAQVWLASVRTMASKLSKIGNIKGAAAQADAKAEVAAFLSNELLFRRTGDATGIREDRLESGAAATKTSAPENSGTEQDIGNITTDENAATGEETLIAKQKAEEATQENRVAELTPAEKKAEAARLERQAPDETLPDVITGKETGKTVTSKGVELPVFEQRTAPVEVKKPKKFVKPVTKGEAAKETSKERSKLSLDAQKDTSEVTEVPPVPDRARMASSEKASVSDARDQMDATGIDYYDNALGDADRAAIMGKLGTDTPERHFAVDETTVGQELAAAESGDLAGKARDFGPFKEILRNVQADVALRMFKQISEYVGGMKIYWLSDEDMARFDSRSGGYYSARGDYIVMKASLRNDPGRLMHVLPHEVTHAAFLHALREHPETYRQIDALMDISANWANKNGLPIDAYGFENVDEFVAEAFSNPEFQEFLAKVELTPQDLARLKMTGLNVLARGKIKTALDWMKVKIAETFGSKTNTMTAFDATMRVGESLLRVSKESREAYYAKNPDRAARAAMATPEEQAKNAKLAAQKKETNAKLVKLGLNDRQAKEASEILAREFGEVSDDTLEEIAKEVKKVAEESKARVKAAKEAATSAGNNLEKSFNDAVARMDKLITPSNSAGFASKYALKLMKLTQIARMADRWFGSENNPVRKISDLMNKNPIIKRRYVKELSNKLDGFREAISKNTPEQIKEFFALAHDATNAQVHPDRPLADQKHLGKDALKGMWAKAQHADLSARYDALPDDLKEMYQKVQETLSEAENTKRQKLMQNILSAAGHADPAMADRFFNGKETEADIATVGETLASHLEKANEFKRLQGPYFNLARRGDWVVQGYLRITSPGNAKVIPAEIPGNPPNVFEFKTRKEAIDYAQSPDLKGIKADIKTGYRDKNTGKTYFEDEEGQTKVSKNDPNAEQFFHVVVQNRHVEFLETKGQARALHKQLKAEGMRMLDVEAIKTQRNAANADMLSDQYSAIRKTLDARKDTSKLTPMQQAEMIGILNEISLRFKGSTRIQSNRLPRRYVRGASKDLVRNTYEYVDQTAGYLAKLDTEPGLEAAMADLDAAQRALTLRGQGFATGASVIANEIRNRVLNRNYLDSNGPMDKAISRLKSITFLMRLGSPGFSIVNATQPLMLTGPVLSAEFNPASASYHMGKAYNDVGAFSTAFNGFTGTAKAVVGKNSQPETMAENVIAGLKEPRERDMMNRMMDLGLLGEDSDIGLEDLARRPEKKLINSVGITIDYLEGIFRVLPQAIETINRSVSALAAYRLMYDRTGNHEKSIQYAADIVDETQGNNSAVNSAPIFNTPAGRVILQFKKFAQNMVVLLAKSVRRSVMGGGPGERRKGMLTLAYMMAATQLAAGSAGLPWEPIKLALMAARFLGLSDDDMDDFNRSIEAWYKWMTGSDKVAEALTFGVTRAIPFGMDFDLGSRLGSDSLFTFGSPKSTSPADVKSWLFDTTLGANAGTVVDVGTGISRAMSGDILGGVAKGFPVKVVSDVAKAIQNAKTPQEFALKSLGLNPGRMVRESDAARYKAGDKAKAQNQEYALRDAYVAARGPAEIAKLKSLIRDHNNKLPKGSPYRIDFGPKSILEKKRQEAAKG